MPALIPLQESARQLAQHVQSRDDLLDKIDTIFSHTYDTSSAPLFSHGISLIGHGDAHRVYRIGSVTSPVRCHIALRIFYRTPCDVDAINLTSDFSAFSLAHRYRNPVPLPLCAVHWTRTHGTREETLAAMLVRDLTDGGTHDIHNTTYEHARRDDEQRDYLIDPALQPTTPDGLALTQAPHFVTVYSKQVWASLPYALADCSVRRGA